LCYPAFPITGEDAVESVCGNIPDGNRGGDGCDISMVSGDEMCHGDDRLMHNKGTVGELDNRHNAQT
jgi:hypothetical protein